MAKIVSLVVKVGAVVFILALPQAYAIQLQLLGGIWIIQLLPPILLGLYTRSCNAPALLIGWAVGTRASAPIWPPPKVLPPRSIRSLSSASPCRATRRSIRSCSISFSPSA